MEIIYDTDTPPRDGQHPVPETEEQRLALLGRRFARLIRLSLLEAPPEIIEAEKRLIAESLRQTNEARDGELIIEARWNPVREVYIAESFIGEMIETRYGDRWNESRSRRLVASNEMPLIRFVGGPRAGQVLE